MTDEKDFNGSASILVPRIRLTTMGARSYSYAAPPPMEFPSPWYAQ